MGKFFDDVERMENEIPDYGYADAGKAGETDRKMRALLVSEVKGMKDTMFHVVQVSYELQRDSLADAAEAAWDEVSSLLAKVQASRLCACRDRHGAGCESCQQKAEKVLVDLVRKDRELVEAVREMKVSVRELYSALLGKGMEKYFIRNLDQIKNHTETVAGILAERERIVRGA